MTEPDSTGPTGPTARTEAGGVEAEGGTAPVVYLHIGTMKSGTSYIQGMFRLNREALAAAGVLYPGETWQDQVDAVRELIEAPGNQRRRETRGRWDRLSAEILAWSGPKAVVSMELLSLAAPARVAAAVESLAPAEVHAVITARDLARVIPSAWQESTQNRQTWTWPAYLSSVTGQSDAEPTALRRFWHQHDLVQITHTWSVAVGAERVHLVVVPPSGGPRDELWRRFCSVVGLDPGSYEGVETLRGNPAVGAASAEFLRRLNVAVRGELDVPAYDRLVKRFLAKNTLAHRTSESRLALPERYLPWAERRATRMTQELEASGIDVVGDLAELIPRPASEAVDVDPAPTADAAPAPVTEPDLISEEEVLDAGLHAVEALVLRLAQATARGERRDRPARSAR